MRGLFGSAGARTTTAIAVLVVLAGIANSAIAQQPYPFSTRIRGENVRLRSEPTADSSVIAVLQRGQPIIVDGTPRTHDGDSYVPVEVASIARHGWVRDIFIVPVSNEPSLSLPVAGQRARTPPPTKSVSPSSPSHRDNRKKHASHRSHLVAATVESPTPSPTAIPNPTSTPVPTSTPRPTPRPTMTPSRITRPTPRPSTATGSTGATARCKDGSYSHSAHHSGTCSGHGGVSTWNP